MPGKHSGSGNGPSPLQVGVALALVVFGAVLLTYATLNQWWEGLAGPTVIILVFGRAAMGAKSTETSAGPQGVREKTEYAWDAPTAEEPVREKTAAPLELDEGAEATSLPESRSRSPRASQPRFQRPADTEPAEG